MENEQEVEHKPCPFCGARAYTLSLENTKEKQVDGNNYVLASIVCMGCNARGPTVLVSGEFDKFKGKMTAAFAEWDLVRTGLTEAVSKLEDLIKIQMQSGNWDYSPYQHGMANGLILAKSVFTNKDPEFLDQPKKWLREERSIELIVQGDSGEKYTLPVKLGRLNKLI